LLERGQAAADGHQRSAMPRLARHREMPPHHHLPAAPDRGLPRSTVARDEQGPDPLSKVRVEAGRRRRLHPTTSAGGDDGERGWREGGGGRRWVEAPSPACTSELCRHLQTI
jgi:hypothetical protein